MGSLHLVALNHAAHGGPRPLAAAQRADAAVRQDCGDAAIAPFGSTRVLPGGRRYRPDLACVVVRSAAAGRAPLSGVHLWTAVVAAQLRAAGAGGGECAGVVARECAHGLAPRLQP